MKILRTKFYRMIGGFKKMFLRNMDDLLLLTGILLISYGTYQIYVPAGYIMLGICLVALAIVWSKGMGVNGHDIE